jgi:hypothetical protein
MPHRRSTARSVSVRDWVTEETPELKEGQVNGAAVGAYFASLREARGMSVKELIDILNTKPYNLKSNHMSVRRFEYNEQQLSWPVFVACMDIFDVATETIVRLMLDKQLTTAQAARLASTEWRRRVDMARTKQVERLFVGTNLNNGEEIQTLRASIEEKDDPALLAAFNEALNDRLQTIRQALEDVGRR